MRVADLEGWDRRARERFAYQADGAIDTWRSHADQVLGGVAWTGDCDDLASTVQDLLGRAGLPLASRFRLLVDSSGRGAVDHMVAFAWADDGGRVVGDTFGEAYPPELMQHRAVAYQRLDEWTPDGAPVWRDGAPWSAG